MREETDDGRDAVRFLVDVMQGSLEGFKAHHRLAAARELLHRGFDDTEPDDPDPGSEPERPHAGPRYRPESPTNPYGPLYPRDTEASAMTRPMTTTTTAATRTMTGHCHRPS